MQGISQETDRARREMEEQVEDKVDKSEMAKLAMALSKKGDTTAILASKTVMPPNTCLSCARPLMHLPNSVGRQPRPESPAKVGQCRVGCSYG